MELLGWRSVKDLSGDGGVIKTITKEGDGFKKPSDRDEVLGAPNCALVCWQAVCYTLLRVHLPRDCHA